MAELNSVSIGGTSFPWSNLIFTAFTTVSFLVLSSTGHRDGFCYERSRSFTESSTFPNLFMEGPFQNPLYFKWVGASWGDAFSQVTLTSLSCLDPGHQSQAPVLSWSTSEEVMEALPLSKKVSDLGAKIWVNGSAQSFRGEFRVLHNTRNIITWALKMKIIKRNFERQLRKQTLCGKELTA